MFRSRWSAGRPLLLSFLAIITAAAAGCGSSDSRQAAAPIPVFNPAPDSPNKDVTLDNESDAMERIKQGTLR